jgi:NAD(P)-dependent dehydrogenase (short-subunit alcohol dehydrogenase family)
LVLRESRTAVVRSCRARHRRWRGLGRAIALTLATAGARVAVNDIDGTAAEQTVDLLAAQGATAHAISGDVSDEHDVERVVASTVEEFGTLDFACNNAIGQVQHQLVAEIDIDDARRMVDIALVGTAMCLKHELRAMRSTGKGGAVVNVSSTAHRRGQVGTGIYSACKAGIEALTRIAANENGPVGIRVNAVAAGAMLTPALLEVLEASPGARSRVEAGIPLGHIAEPSEVADAVLFLCSDLARFTTGDVITVDGGGVLHISGLAAPGD